jgi:RNA polymerase sigma-70 factor (ECF subfamily)
VNLSDEEIIEIIQKDKKKDLFSELFDRYSKKVYHTCLSMVNSQEIAEDLAHDIFLKVFVSLQKYDGKASFSTWLYRISSNFCIDYIRKHKRRSEKIEDYTYELETNTEEDNERELLSSKTELLRKILDELEPEDKMALLMKYQEDMSIKQISQVFEISQSAVKMRLKRAKAKAVKLKTELTKNNG